MAVTRGKTLDFWSHSAAQTRRFGAHLGRLVEPGDVLLLHGTLGAGKTQMAQGLAEGLGIAGPVRSPTFTLINEYHDGRLPLFHVDLYRLEEREELATIGLDELFDRAGVVVVEWPDRAPGWWPEDALHLRLEHADETRRTLRLEPGGPRAEALLKAFKGRAFATPHL